jgi:hypothetical protein
VNPVVVPDEPVGLYGVPVKGFPDGAVVGVFCRIPMGVQEDHVRFFIARQAVEPQGVIPVMIRDEEGYFPPFPLGALGRGERREGRAHPEKQENRKPAIFDPHNFLTSKLDRTEGSQSKTWLAQVVKKPLIQNYSAYTVFE